MISHLPVSLQWCYNECGGVSTHWRLDCLLNCLFRRTSKKTSKLQVTGLCAGNSLVTGEFPAQRASNMENVSIWWCHDIMTEGPKWCLHFTCSHSNQYWSIMAYFDEEVNAPVLSNRLIIGHNQSHLACVCHSRPFEDISQLPYDKFVLRKSLWSV